MEHSHIIHPQPSYLYQGATNIAVNLGSTSNEHEPVEHQGNTSWPPPLPSYSTALSNGPGYEEYNPQAIQGMHNQLSYNAFNGQNLDSFRDVGDIHSQHGNINDQQDERQVAAQLEDGLGWSEDSGESELSDYNVNAHTKSLQLVRQPTSERPQRHLHLDNSESDDDGDYNSVRYVHTGYRINLSRRKNRYRGPVPNAQKLWLHATSANNPEKIRAVINHYEQVSAEMRELITRRLHTQVAFPLEGDDARVWGEFMEIYTSCHQGMKLLSFEHRRALAEAHYSSVMLDTYEGFRWPSICVIFVAGPNGSPPEAKILALKPKKSPTILDWHAQDDPKARPLQATLQAYGNLLWTKHWKEFQIDDDGSLSDGNHNVALDTVSILARKRGADAIEDGRRLKKKKPTPQLPREGDIFPTTVVFQGLALTIYGICDGIYLVKELKTGGFENHHKNKTLIRFLTANRLVRVGRASDIEAPIQWTILESQLADIAWYKFFPTTKVDNLDVPIPLPLAPKNATKAHIALWLDFFEDHQSHRIPWEKGLLFKLTPKAKALAAFAHDSALYPDQESQVQVQEQDADYLLSGLELRTAGLPSTPAGPIINMAHPNHISSRSMNTNEDAHLLGTSASILHQPQPAIPLFLDNQGDTAEGDNQSDPLATVQRDHPGCVLKDSA
ncbi:SubName: Full=Uncharacterized protein {ECO:0000313/EMBL:CCA72687.1} [Serendipita indica DSM 11827]|uniref:Uncharacterized protein n=1 Tax=Serendipita indica (strain DSM 11827) TaxID=1109443 RepID=G4TMZ4_SERID|nr:SubName: Full=Uncharacterized protein {ECO:0000313/EMBL:CCA72687.1} [Serendipita indica DSM 11827]CCA72687.1 hypothetical protein PIIN_06624 [Serendipita indica DSM 11827]